MAETLEAQRLRVAPLRESRVCAALAEFGDYAVARVAEPHVALGWSVDERLVAARDGAASGAEWRVPAQRCLRIPATLDDTAALALPPLMAALACWQALRLELGDVAAVCGATPLAALLRRAAHWQGALPVIALDAGDQALNDAVPVAVDDARQALARLKVLQRMTPGFAAVDVGGRAWCADILFQALPRWARLRLGAAHQQAVTVDFYKDVHLKGARITTAPITLDTLLGDVTQLEALRVRAVRLLENAATGAEVKACLGL